jgi:hypothetical protein
MANRDIPNDPKFVFSHIDFTSSSSCLSFYLGYDALLDMISWKPCPSLLRDRSTVSFIAKDICYSG